MNLVYDCNGSTPKLRLFQLRALCKEYKQGFAGYWPSPKSIKGLNLCVASVSC